jgi:hypothetical protein
MYSHTKAAGRFSFLLTPAGIVVGCVLALFGVVAGMVEYPLSSI